MGVVVCNLIDKNLTPLTCVSSVFAVFGKGFCSIYFSLELVVCLFVLILILICIEKISLSSENALSDHFPMLSIILPLLVASTLYV